VLLARGPFAVDDERRLFEHYAIDVLVTKDSGGESTGAKLAVARERSVAVVMVDRPTLPDVPSAATAAGILTLLGRYW
jgi:precorrin-6A/cobalt-precorrin-6A reductase